MSYENPGVAEFKSYFTRDFTYGTDPTTVNDVDITKAIDETLINFNADFFGNQTSYTIGFLLLTAHFMVMDLRASSQGVQGQFNWQQSSKGVGSVSEGYAIPQRILENPEFSWMCKTNYGAKYLMLILPSLSGQVFTVCGRTKA